MIDENDTVKITDLAMLPTLDDSFIVNTDECSNYTLTTTISPDGSNGWVGFVTAAPPPTTVTFYGNNGEAVSIDFTTGGVNIAPHMTTDAAAKLFWDRVMAMNPMKPADNTLDHLVGKIDDYFSQVVMPEVDAKIASTIRTFVPNKVALNFEVERTAVNIPSHNVAFECTLPAPKTARGTSISELPELPKTPEERALEAYTRAMKVVK